MKPIALPPSMAASRRVRAQVAAASLLLLAGAALLTAPSARAGGQALPKPVIGLVADAAELSAPPASLATAAERPTNRLVIRYRQSGGKHQAMAAAGTTSPTQASLFRAGLQALEVRQRSGGAQLLRLNQRRSVADMQAIARQLMADDPAILWAEPDYWMDAQAVPSDPLYAQQWHYQEARAGANLPSAWDLSTGSGVVVGVLDTGVRPHADLLDNLLPGRDLIDTLSVAVDGDGRDGDANDPGDGCNGRNSSWHGTHVAGTIAAVANNGQGGVGVAPAAKILPVRVLGCGGGYNSDIADGLVWAAGGNVAGQPVNPTPAKVLNLSLGGMSPCSNAMQTAIDTARGLGAVVIVAAGNSNTAATRFSPANCRGVVTVAAVGRTAARAPYSNTGANVDIAAPGGNMSTGSADGILSTLDAGSTTPAGDTYQYYQGTSMATPHVAGVAALMLARRADLKPFELEVLLRSQVRSFPVACAGCGTGLLDATKAVQGVLVGSDASPRTAEVEPNDRHVTAQALSGTPVTVEGFVSPTKDLDIYKVSVPAGGSLSMRLLSEPETNVDLELRNLTGAMILSSKRGAGYSDNILWVNRGRAAVEVYPRVVWIAGATGNVLGKYSLEVVPTQASAPSAVTQVAEVEPNDRHVSAQALTDPSNRVSGFVSPAKDLDIYRISVPSGATLTLQLTPTTGANHDLELRNLTGAVLAASRLGTGRVDSISWTNRAAAAVDVYPRVIWISGGTGATDGAYTLETAY